MSRLVYALESAPQHCFPRHPECPARAEAIQAALERLEVFRGCAEGQVKQLTEYPPLPEGLLPAVHTAEHVESLRATSAQLTSPTAVRDPDDPDGPTFATPSSYEDAMRAACAAVALVDAIMASSSSSSSSGSSSQPSGTGGGSQTAGGSSSSSQPGRSEPGSSSSQAQPAATGFSICRPPGHHAAPGDQMGFCLLNNAALAARHAQRGHGIKKVLILDWDVHHGNGTQDIFYTNPSVLLIDLHQAEVWPGTGGIQERGAGAGVGATLNVPLPWYSGHAAAQLVFERVVAPAARRFHPDFIMVSAGYDAHWQDPLEQLQFQAATYHWLAEAVRKLAEDLCGGRLLLLLEGGYNQQALGESAAETILALLQKPSVCPLLEPAQLPHPEPADQLAALVDELRSIHGL